MRTLCSIQKIKNLIPIEGKDKIVLAEFYSTAWRVIVQKESFSVNDLCVYCEYDTVLPEKPEFEFLRKRCYSEKWRGFRITAMKMAGVISEGIVFPLSILPNDTYKENQDVTDIIGAIKYDPELSEEKALVEKSKSKIPVWLLRIKFIRDFFYPKSMTGSWPSFFPGKTDETRIQVLWNSIEQSVVENPNQLYYVTEKLDGTSWTAGYYKRKLYVCSRNNWYKTATNNNYWEAAKVNNIERCLKRFYSKYKRSLVLQGEIIGPKIQGNKYDLKSNRLYIFNIYIIEENRYVNSEELESITSLLGIQKVPILEKTFFKWKSVDELFEYSKGKSILNINADREGIVIRTDSYCKPLKGMSNMWSFKVINPDFLIKGE